MAGERDIDLTSSLLGDEETSQRHPLLVRRWMGASIAGLLILGLAGSGLVGYKLRSQRKEKALARLSYVSAGRFAGGSGNENFGTGLSISVRGEYFVASSPYRNSNSGIVRLFKQTATSGSTRYTQVDSKEGPGGAGSYFGTSVSIDNKGQYVAVGAQRENAAKGCVHVYKITGDKLVKIGDRICGANSSDQFGRSVSLVGFDDPDNSYTYTVTLAVGAPSAMNNNSGYAKVYKLNGSSFKQIGDKITKGLMDKQFGLAVSLGSDGLTIIVGAPMMNQAYVYRFQSNVWAQVGNELTYAGAPSNAYCGTSVAIDDSSMNALLGCLNYQKVGYWNRLVGNKYFEIDTVNANLNGFGTSLAMSADGTKMVVGNPLYGAKENGSVKMYVYDEGFQQISQNDGKSDWGKAGYATAMSPDGAYVLVGSPSATNSLRSDGYVEVLVCDACL